MRKLASIRKIEDVQTIPGADRIIKVRIGGWWCVASKDYGFKPGDLCCYFEIDSLIPIREPYLFLEKNCAKALTTIDNVTYEGYRLRTKTFRGTTSQGLAMPLLAFQGIAGEEGADVTDFLGVVKYERVLVKGMDKDIVGDFPGYLQKTDEERIQNLSEYLEKYRGQVFYATEKLDGCSSTYCKYENEFDVYQKTVRLRRYSDNPYWKVALKYGFQERLPNNFAVQAEVIGPGVDNALGLSEVDGFIFSVFDIQKSTYLNFHDMILFLSDLELKMVPVVHPEFVLNHTCDELLVMADRKSDLNPNKNAEGLVFRLKDSIEKVSFKVISNCYLMGEK